MMTLKRVALHGLLESTTLIEEHGGLGFMQLFLKWVVESWKQLNLSSPSHLRLRIIVYFLCSIVIITKSCYERRFLAKCWSFLNFFFIDSN